LNILLLSDNSYIRKEIQDILNCSDYKYDFIESEKIDFENKLYSKYDLLISAHYKRLIPKNITDNLRCINIHPGFNPHNRGWYPHVFSIINGLPTGATIHEITEEVDNGPIIVQEEVPVYLHDTSYSLYQKILYKEVELFEKHFESIIKNEYKTFIPLDKGNINYKKDFIKLCAIDSNNSDTFENHLKLLKALSFEGYNNGFIVDNSGLKTHVRLELKLE
jgi:dTDP-4-amino-4,6-dideoxyglucose formyltransferase